MLITATTIAGIGEVRVMVVLVGVVAVAGNGSS
jgi:hypothetical protein